MATGKAYDAQRAVEFRMPPDAAENKYDRGSPEWWTQQLAGEITDRLPLVNLYDDYFEGRHKLTFASSQFRESFGQMLSAVSDNWLPLVIEASVERLRPQGFRFGENREGDADAWAMWQESCMDADASLAFTESCKHGESYLLVWPEETNVGVFGRFFNRRSGESRPRIYAEHPSQFAVARSAGDRRRFDAALKLWQEPDGPRMATLYRPDATYRFQHDQKRGWIARSGVDPVTKNRLGIVPAVPLTNLPSMIGSRPPGALTVRPHSAPDVPVGLGRSDIADVITTIDQINKLLCDMLVSSEYGAFRQRWATGLEVPDDEDGNPKEPFQSAVDRLWIAEGEAGQNARFGEFNATDLKNYFDAIESRVNSLAARTRTPPHYLLGSMVNVSGDALKAAETGLASKVRGKQVHFGEGLESAMRIAFAWMNDERANDTAAEVDWAPSESRSESEYVDSLVKKMALGVPKEQLWADAGYSPQQIERFKSMLLEESLNAGLFEPVVEPDAAEAA